MRLPKARREQLAAQYLIATLCVWDVEQRWDLDPELACAWDLGRFDDPYRRVLLPKYPPTRQGVCAALAVQFGTPMEDLAAHIATGKVYAASTKPWDVAVDSLQKLTALVRQAGYGTRIWRVAEGRLDLHQAYRESDRENRSPAQREAKQTLWSLAGHLHADDVAIWLTTHWHFAIPHMEPIAPERMVPLSRYRLLRDLFDGLGRHEGADEAEAFVAYLEHTAADRHASSAWYANVRRAEAAYARAAASPDCFRALGLAWPCTEDAVKHAYRTLAFAAHPDQGGSAEAFHTLAEAYEAALKFLERSSPNGTA